MLFGHVGDTAPLVAAHSGAAVVPMMPEAARVLVAAHSGAAAHSERLDLAAGPSMSTRIGHADTYPAHAFVDNILPRMDEAIMDSTPADAIVQVVPHPTAPCTRRRHPREPRRTKLRRLRCLRKGPTFGHLWRHLYRQHRQPRRLCRRLPRRFGPSRLVSYAATGGHALRHFHGQHTGDGPVHCSAAADTEVTKGPHHDNVMRTLLRLDAELQGPLATTCLDSSPPVPVPPQAAWPRRTPIGHGREPRFPRKPQFGAITSLLNGRQYVFHTADTANR